MNLAYRITIITNPSYIVRRLWRGVRTGEFFWDCYYFVRFIFMPTQAKAVPANYYARERWPKCDFLQSPPKPLEYQQVRYETVPVLN